jgi:hypothetical protein
MFHPAVSGYNRGRTHFHPGLYRLVPGVLCPERICNRILVAAVTRTEGARLYVM